MGNTTQPVSRPLGLRARGWLLAAIVVTVVLFAGCSRQAEQPFATNAASTLPRETPPSTSSAAPLDQVAATAPAQTSPESIAAAALTPPPTDPNRTAAPPAALPATVAPNAQAYRIQIPRLGINLPVAEGDVPRDVDNAQTPEYYAFHLPGTSMFDAGNTYIYAHARVGMFLSLWNARIGDLVIVRTPAGTRQYIVEEIHPRVPPTETSWAGPTADTRLTLQTSTGPNGNDPRFVVVARPG